LVQPIDRFRDQIWDFYHDHGRDLPWRRDVTPYGVFVSEIMLQQTRVSRVMDRWGRWLERFDGFGALAAAPVAAVLEEWQGMGYNRRALWLRQAAQVIDAHGKLPRDPAELVKLPGVGPHTAGSIAAFAYNEPTVFIETNIRRVFIHEFFPDQEVVADSAIRPLVEASLDHEHPREWYWALMDYGADLARRVPNPNRRSRHYTVQSPFEGSARQVRSQVLRALLDGPKTRAQLGPDVRLEQVLADLEREGFIRRVGTAYEVVR
jgi:A/G-specific adenine glycosylase